MSTLALDFKHFAQHFPSQPIRWIAVHYAKRHLKSHRRIPPDMAFMLGYLMWADKKYSDSQPRVPACSPSGGQWTSGDGGASNGNLDVISPIVTALNDFGTLISELPQTDFLTGITSGRLCVYQFDTFSNIVQGPTNFSCPTWVPWSAVTHGQILNDNFMGGVRR